MPLAAGRMGGGGVKEAGTAKRRQSEQINETTLSQNGRAAAQKSAAVHLFFQFPSGLTSRTRKDEGRTIICVISVKPRKRYI